MREAIRVRNYSIRTEDAYCLRIKQFIYFHNMRHPLEMGEHEISEYLTHLGCHDNVAASTQNQALNAINFLYKVVLNQPFGELQNVARAKSPGRRQTSNSRI